MPTDPTRPNLVNPLQLWTDLGLRALESSVSSAQKMGDTLDRITRAGANAEVTEIAQQSPTTPVPSSARPLAPASTIALVNQLQRTTFDAMQQGWLQWMSTLGTLASVTAGTAAPLAAAGGSTAAQPQPARADRQQSGNDSESRAASGVAEHAHAAGDAPKRTRRAAAKRTPRSRNS